MFRCLKFKILKSRFKVEGLDVEVLILRVNALNLWFRV
jgi:hypothetical protein